MKNKILLIILVCYSCSDNSTEKNNIISPEEKKLYITSWIKYTTENSKLSNNKIYSFTIDNDKVWIGTPSGIVLFKDNSFRSYNYPTYRTDAVDILVENFDLLWYRHRYGNIYQFIPSRWMAFEHTIYDIFIGNPVCPEGIIDWEIDNFGNKWAACNVGSKYKLAKFSSSPSNFTYIDRPGVECVNRSIEIIDSTIWIGTSCGLYKFDGTNWEFYDPSNSKLPEYYVYTIKKDYDGNLFILTSKWITKYDGINSWESVNIEGKGSDLSNPSLAIDELSTIFIGNPSGLEIFIGSKWIVLSEYNSDLIGQVNCIESDQIGTIWIGTDMGIIKFKYEFK